MSQLLFSQEPIVFRRPLRAPASTPKLIGEQSRTPRVEPMIQRFAICFFFVHLISPFLRHEPLTKTDEAAAGIGH